MGYVNREQNTSMGGYVLVFCANEQWVSWSDKRLNSEESVACVPLLQVRGRAVRLSPERQKADRNHVLQARSQKLVPRVVVDLSISCQLNFTYILCM